MIVVDLQSNLAGALRALRKSKGLSQEQAVKELGIARNTLSLYETGKLDPPLSTLVKLVEFYGFQITIRIEPKL